MKTTVDIPDELMIRAKKRAAELRRPLRELMIEGLKARLREPSMTQAARAMRRVRWTIHEGGLPPGVNLADRPAMSRWLRERP